MDVLIGDIKLSQRFPTIKREHTYGAEYDTPNTPECKFHKEKQINENTAPNLKNEQICDDKENIEFSFNIKYEPVLNEILEERDGFLESKVFPFAGKNQETSQTDGEPADTKNSTNELFEVYDLDDFDMEPFHPMELESEREDDIIDYQPVSKMTEKNKIKRRTKKKIKNPHRATKITDYPDFTKELKIILKDCLAGGGTESKNRPKYFTIPLNNTPGSISKADSFGLNKRELKRKRDGQSSLNIFKCAECDFQSYFKNGISAHYTNMHVKRKNTKSCTHCLQSFNTQKMLERHMWKKHRKEIPDLHKKLKSLKFYACDLCDYLATASCVVEIHKLSHVGLKDMKLFSCTHCDYKTPRQHGLEKHFKNIHSENKKTHKCIYCKKQIVAINNLADHLLNFHNDKIDKGSTEIMNYTIVHCQVCDFRTVKPSKLSRHMAKHGDTSQATTFNCYHCGFETLDKKRLVIHIDTHLEKTFKCRFCQDCFSRQTLLDTHILRKHGDNKEIIEKELGKKVYSCTFCNFKTMVSEANLIDHVTSEHRKKRKCQFCDFVTDMRNDMQTHMRRKHKPRKRTKCELCGASFCERMLVASHILRCHKTDEGRKLFKAYNYVVYSCTICTDFETVFNARYKEHMYKVHHDESHLMGFMKLKYSCPQCDLKTKSKAALKVHMKTHSDVKPFKCSYCDDARFKKNICLATHILKEHRNMIEDSPSEIVGVQVHSCSFCRAEGVVYETMYKTMMFWHQYRAHGFHNEELTVFKCYSCRFVAVKKMDLVVHMGIHAKYRNKL